MNTIVLKGFIPTILKNKFEDIEVIYEHIDKLTGEISVSQLNENIPDAKITVIDVFCGKLALTDFLSNDKIETIRKEAESQIFPPKRYKIAHYDKSTLSDLI